MAGESHKVSDHVRLLSHCARQASDQAQQLQALAADLVLSAAEPVKLVLEAIPLVRGELIQQRVEDPIEGPRSAFAEQLSDWLARADLVVAEWARMDAAVKAARAAPDPKVG